VDETQDTLVPAVDHGLFLVVHVGRVEGDEDVEGEGGCMVYVVVCVCGLWCVVCGVWFMVCGVWFMVYVFMLLCSCIYKRQD
jgi:hypothetical protein